MVTGLIVNEMVELLCTNLQKDDLAAINASLSADGATASDKEALLKVSPTFMWVLTTAATVSLLWLACCGRLPVAAGALDVQEIRAWDTDHLL